MTDWLGGFLTCAALWFLWDKMGRDFWDYWMDMKKKKPSD